MIQLVQGSFMQVSCKINNIKEQNFFNKAQISEAQSIRRNEKKYGLRPQLKILLKKMHRFENLNADYNESEI